MDRLAYLNFKSLCIYIVFAFFILPGNFENYFRSLFYLTFLGINIIFFIKNSNIMFSKKKLFIFILLIYTYILIILFSPYSVIFTSNTLITLIIISMSMAEEKFIIKMVKSKYNVVLYYFLMVSLIIQLVLGLRYTYNGDISLAIIGDKNYSGVVIILFYMYCDKNGFKIGRLLSIFSLILLKSRGSLLMLIFLLLIKLFRVKAYNFLKVIRMNKINHLFIIMALFTVAFSYYWTFFVSVHNVAAYETSLNDESNKSRFASDVFSIEKLRENGKLLLYGYDENLKDIFGINHSDPYYDSKFMGVRLVQPHNSILNVFIKSGILFSLLYFYFLSKIIDKKYVLNNLEYIIPYLVNSVFLHRLLDGKFLIFWIVIILLPNLKIKRVKIKNN